MFTCQYKRNGLRILEVHYSNNISKLHDQVKSERKFDILKCYQVDANLKNLSEFNTLHIDLNQDVDSIVKNFAKNTRNEINKCYRDDGVNFCINDNVTDEDISEFITLFRDFDKLKGFNTNIDELQASLIRNKNNVALCKVLKGNVIVVFNVYYFDENRARLKCSVSIRGEDNQERNLIGRCNRTSYLEAIKFFKDKNCTVFDLGGVSLTDDKDKKNIDSFKSKFGGIPVVEYEGNCPVSLKGYLFMMIYNLKKKIIS